MNRSPSGYAGSVSGALIRPAAPRLGDVCTGRDNNLNLIRVIAATAVLGSHAYAVTGVIEPFAAIFGPNVGHFAVVVFFAISGLLISRS